MNDKVTFHMGQNDADGALYLRASLQPRYFCCGGSGYMSENPYGDYYKRENMLIVFRALHECLDIIADNCTHAVQLENNEAIKRAQRLYESHRFELD